MKKFLAIAAFALMMIPALAQNHTGYTLPDEPKRAKYIDFPSQDKGLWFAAQLTPALFLGREGFNIQADLIAGYRFGEFFKVGAGISPGILAGRFKLPVYLDLRGNIISQESRMAVPYWSLDAGYTISSYCPGVYVSPTVGVRVGMPRNDFIAGLTYILQGVPGTALHGVGLRLGFEF